MMLIFGVLFVLSTQPIIIISSLILIILIYSLMIYWILSNFWFCYLIILIMMSGVLVVFTYMMSVLPNESFEVSSLILVMLSIVLLYGWSTGKEYSQDLGAGAMNIWSSLLMVVSSFLVIYLLVMMVIIVWLSILEKGSIRII